MERTVNIYVNFERISAPLDKVQQAIGRLSMWANYPSVSIFNDGNNDMVAIYYDRRGNRKYVIGAVWHGGEYGFHS